MSQPTETVDLTMSSDDEAALPAQAGTPVDIITFTLSSEDDDDDDDEGAMTRLEMCLRGRNPEEDPVKNKYLGLRRFHDTHVDTDGAPCVCARRHNSMDP